MLRNKYLAGGQQFIQRGQAGLVVAAQTTRIVKVNVGQLRALLANFQQLVDLLLVFGKGKAHLGVVDGEHALQGGCVLVKRNGHSTQRLHRQHGGVQTRPVGTQHHHVVTLAQTGLVQTASQLFHQHGEIGPRKGLPNTVLFFPHGRIERPLSGMV